MTTVRLQPLTFDRIADVLRLDQLCLGGLWNEAGYGREIESPNSDLLVLHPFWNAKVSAQSAPLQSAPDRLIPDRSIPNQSASDQPEDQSDLDVPTQAASATRQADSKRSDLRLPELSPSHPMAVSRPALQPSLKTSGNEVQDHTLSGNIAPGNIELIGMGCSWAIVDEAHITLLAVHPAYRRQGLAKAILLALLRRARSRRLQWATLEVRVSNQGAIALYESLGFQRVGERRKYYQDTGENALILWKKGLQSEAFHADLERWETQNRITLNHWGWRLDQSPTD